MVRLDEAVDVNTKDRFRPPTSIAWVTDLEPGPAWATMVGISRERYELTTHRR